VFERQLRYSDLAQIDLAEAIIMYCVQITLALCGFGAWSLIAAIMSRSVAGTIFVYWKHPHFYLPIPSWTEIKKLLPFGIPFQANAILPALHGLVLPLVLTQFLSVNEIGLILWTMGLVSIPTFLAANYNQVIYSSLSRLQTDPVEIRRVASRATELAILIFGFIFGLGAASYVFIINTVFESKWAPAKFLMPVAILSVGFSISRYLAAPILNSSGKAYLRFKIEAIATVLEFILAWFLTSWSGSIGYLWATVIVNILALAICAYVVKYRLRKETGRRFVAVFAASLIPFLILSWGGWQKYLVPSLLIFIGGFFSILFILDSGAKADAKKVMEDVYGFIKAGFSKTNE
jgi:O-antigen/teichoic acid export membrane protein